jgi:hypothetical protein
MATPSKGLRGHLSEWRKNGFRPLKNSSPSPSHISLPFTPSPQILKTVPQPIPQQPAVTATIASPPTSSVHPIVSRDLWIRAVEALSPQQRAVLAANKLAPQATLDDTLGPLLNLAEARRKGYAEKQWKPQVFGRKVDLQNIVKGICAGLEKFKEIGDIVVSFDPVHAALPWAGVRTLLMV